MWDAAVELEDVMESNKNQTGKPILFDEDEVVDRMFSFMANSGGLPRLPPDVVARATDRTGDLAMYLYDELNRFLQDPDMSADVKVSEQRLKQATGEKLTLWQRKKGGKTDKIIIYRVKGSLIPTALSLAGLTFGILLMSLTLPISATGFLYGQAKRFVVLQGDNDAAAIRAYEAFAKLKVERRVNSPSTRELAETLGEPLEEITNALTSLINKQVLAIAEWGGKPQDWLHPDNRWKLPL
jgi:hypothetical protein